MGDARDREGRQCGQSQISGQQRRRRLVGQPRPNRRRQPLLEARQRHHVEAVAGSRRRDARSRSRGPLVHRDRQSRSMGRPHKIEGTLNAVPYIRELGVTPENLIYKFDFRDSRFIFLWSGKYDYRSPSNWDADRPKYEEQIAHMKEWLDEAKAKGIPRCSSLSTIPFSRGRAWGLSLVAFIVWWSFLVGHVLVNIMGFEA